MNERIISAARMVSAIDESKLLLGTNNKHVKKNGKLNSHNFSDWVSLWSWLMKNFSVVLIITLLLLTKRIAKQQSERLES